MKIIIYLSLFIYKYSIMYIHFNISVSLFIRAMEMFETCFWKVIIFTLFVAQKFHTSLLNVK